MRLSCPQAFKQIEEFFKEHQTLAAIERVKELIIADITKMHLDKVKLVFSATGLKVPYV